MVSLYITAIILTIVIILLSYISSKKNPALGYVIPVTASLLSIVLFIISFFIGEWSGMGLGAFSITLLISSIIALIVFVIVKTIQK